MNYKSGHHIFVSYNNIDYQFALRISTDLITWGYQIWIDRLVVSSADHLDGEQLTDCAAAIIIYSEHYDKSNYCRTELEHILALNIPIYVLSLTPIKSLPESYEQFTLMDFSLWQDKTHYQTAFQQLRDAINTEPVSISSEARYLYELLYRIELEQLQTLTARACFFADAKATTRPRGYSSVAWLTQGNYQLQTASVDTDAQKIQLEDITEWLNLRQQLLITGGADTGKTALLLAMARYLVNRYFSDRHRPIPLLARLSDWDASWTLQQFLAELWKLDGELIPLLQRGAVVLLLDCNEYVERTDSRIIALSEWITGADAPSIIITASPENPLNDINIMTKLVIGSLSQDQITSIMKASFLEPHLPDDIQHPITVDQLTYQIIDWVVRGAYFKTTYGDSISRAFENLRTLIQPASLHNANVEALTAQLKTLALKLYDASTLRQFSLAQAVEILGNNSDLQSLIDVGIVEKVGVNYGFVSSNLQTYYGLLALQEQGLTSRIFAPAFDEEGQWVAKTWEKVFTRLPDFASVKIVQESLNKITPTNPYLALRIAFDTGIDEPSLIKHALYHSFTVEDSLHWSETALKALLAPVIQQSVIQIALYQLLSETHDLTVAQRILTIIQALYPVDESFRQNAKNSDYEFAEMFFSTFEEYPQEVYTLSTLALTTDSDDDVRISALRALAFLPENVSLYPYITLLQNADYHHDVLDGLMFTSTSRMLQILFLAALSSSKTMYPMILDQIVDSGRRMSMRLLQLIDEAQLPIDDYVSWFAALDEDIVLRSFYYQVERSVYGEETLTLTDGEVTATVRQLLDSLSRHMQQISDLSSFESFVNDVFPKIRRRERMKPTSAELLKFRLQSMELKSQNGHTDSSIPESLKQKLNHKEWIIRCKAVEQLKDYPDEVAIPYLLERVRDEDNEVQLTAINGLPSPNRYSDVLAILLDVLDDYDDYHVVHAVMARLREVDSDDIEGILREKLAHTGKVNVTAAMLELLSSATSDDAVSALCEYIYDDRQAWLGEKRLGEIAYTSLGMIKTPYAERVYASINEAIPTTTTVTSDNEYEATQEPVLEHEPISYETESERTISIIYGMIDDIRSDDWQISQSAARQLRNYSTIIAKRHTDDDVEALLSAINDPNWVVRWAIVESLAWLKNPMAIEPIAKQLADENWVLCVASIRALIELDAKEKIPVIAQYLNSNHSSIREAAAEAIGQLGDSSHAMYLEQATQDSDELVRFATVQSLIKLGGNDTIKLLIPMRHDNYTHIRWHIAEYLTSLAHPKLIKYYTVMLKDMTKPSWETLSVSDLAETALSSIESKESKNVLEKWSQVKHRFK